MNFFLVLFACRNAVAVVEFEIVEALESNLKYIGKVLELTVEGKLGNGNSGFVSKVSTVLQYGTRTFALKKVAEDPKTSKFLRNEWAAEHKRNEEFINTVFASGFASGAELNIAHGSKVEAILIEYLDGQNLYESGFGNIGTSLGVILSVALDVVEALEGLLKCGMIHGDIKAENIVYKVVSRKQIATLVDFGCAGYEGHKLDNELTVGGRRIMSPSHQDGQGRHRNDDLRALMYLLVLPKYNGKLPWDDAYLNLQQLNIEDENCGVLIRDIINAKVQFEKNLDNSAALFGPELTKILLAIRRVCDNKSDDYSPIREAILDEMNKVSKGSVS